MASARNQLVELIELNCIPPEKIDEALVKTRVFPDGKGWLRFVDHLLLWLGGMALAFAVMFFIAYNWADIGRFAKFAAVESLIVLAVLAYLKLDEHKITAKAALFMAVIFLGVLLALYGQVYQTGADPWQLFFNWALLMLPWAVIGRFPAIWIVWITLIDLSIILYFMAFPRAVWFLFGHDAGMYWILFVFNSFALAIWELLSSKWQWLAERWAVRLLATGCGVCINWLAIVAVLDLNYAIVGIVWLGLSDAIAGIVWLIWLVGLYYIYRNIRHDLFMLAGLALSAIAVVMSFISQHIMDAFGPFGALLIALSILGMGTGAVVWLRKINREWRS